LPLDNQPVDLGLAKDVDALFTGIFFNGCKICDPKIGTAAVRIPAALAGKAFPVLFCGKGKTAAVLVAVQTALAQAPFRGTDQLLTG
jgi:hypothetical protein